MSRHELILLCPQLAKGAAPDADPVHILRLTVAALRPRRADDTTTAIANVRALAQRLAAHPQARAGVQAALGRLLADTRHVSLYVDAGLLPQRGFVSEATRRLAHKLLPDYADPGQLKDMLGLVFDRARDGEWVSAVPDEVWQELARQVLPAPAPAAGLPRALAQLAEALKMLSYRIAADGIDLELVRVAPEVEEYESPFVAQNGELVQFVDALLGGGDAAPDDRHLRVLLEQCDEFVERLRRRTARLGTSIRLTYLLQRLRQHLRRMSLMLDVLEHAARPQDDAAAGAPALALFKALVRGQAGKNDLGLYGRQIAALLALRVTENAARTGEHYITETRGEYWAMWRSAAGAGPVIAIMAMIKIRIGALHLPPLTEALLFCLNYGLGFVLIHVLHCTVATKQPAMTAATIAATLGEDTGRNEGIERVAGLAARTMRSQVAAILGNVGLAVPTAMLIGLAIHRIGGTAFVGPDKAAHLLADQHPLVSGAVLYAAIAGVCLFLSGLIAGYYDNVAAYNRVPDRLRQLAWARRLIGPARLDRLAHYVDDNLGALAGNFAFGFLLGGTSALGALSGLPLDIRHIAFSSAFVGYAAAARDFALTAAETAWAAAGIAAIGLTNLAVSFSLALWLALRARQTEIARPRTLLRSILARLARRPAEFFLPPRDAPVSPEPRG